MKKIDEIYPAIAVVILDSENRILFQKRSDTGVWGLPCGHVEPGETVKEAAIREVLEETNLQIVVKKLIGIYSDPSFQIFTYPTGKCVHFITTCFLAEVLGGTLRCNSSESLELRFFSKDSLPPNTLTMNPKFMDDVFSKNEQSFIR